MNSAIRSKSGKVNIYTGKQQTGPQTNGNKKKQNMEWDQGKLKNKSDMKAF